MLLFPLLKYINTSKSRICMVNNLLMVMCLEGQKKWIETRLFWFTFSVVTAQHWFPVFSKFEKTSWCRETWFDLRAKYRALEHRKIVYFFRDPASETTESWHMGVKSRGTRKGRKAVTPIVRTGQAVGETWWELEPVCKRGWLIFNHEEAIDAHKTIHQLSLTVHAGVPLISPKAKE